MRLFNGNNLFGIPLCPLRLCGEVFDLSFAGVVFQVTSPVVALLLLVPFQDAVVVAVADVRRLGEIIVRRRRGALPFETAAAPGVGRGFFPSEQ